VRGGGGAFRSSVTGIGGWVEGRGVVGWGRWREILVGGNTVRSGEVEACGERRAVMPN
jgi:hypothetical protein